MSSSLENLKIGFIASGRMPQAMIKGILGSGESGLLIRLTGTQRFTVTHLD